MWTFLRFLPLMIGKNISQENAYWQHFIEVVEILHYILRPIVQPSTPGNLSAVISSNLYDF